MFIALKTTENIIEGYTTDQYNSGNCREDTRTKLPFDLHFGNPMSDQIELFQPPELTASRMTVSKFYNQHLLKKAVLTGESLTVLRLAFSQYCRLFADWTRNEKGESRKILFFGTFTPVPKEKKAWSVPVLEFGKNGWFETTIYSYDTIGSDYYAITLKIA